IPLIIMGETGCGKTKLLMFMADILGISMKIVDVHADYTINDLQRDLFIGNEEYKKWKESNPNENNVPSEINIPPVEIAKRNPNEIVLVFLDEVNTSPEVGAFKEVICDHSLKGIEFPSNLVIVAALNPFRLRKSSIKLQNTDENDE